MVNEVRALGFDHVELGHGTRLSLLEGVQEAVAANEIKVSSLHNFCPLPLGFMGPAPNCYLPSSPDESERHLAVKHTLRTIDCAASLGATAIVMHLGLVPMRDYTTRLLDLCAKGGYDTPKFCRWRDKALAVRDKRRPKHLDQVYRTLETILPPARAAGVRLGMETRFGIEEIPDEEEMEQILTRFGADAILYWHDVGHTMVKELLGLMRTEAILERFRGRTAGMHLQDFAPPADDHLAPGLGIFDFARLAPFVTNDMTLAWEIHPQWSAEQIREGVQQVHGLLGKPVTV
ncbi:MAG TPA: TIM barrel protein [Verrucomicrobiae bacterium]|nr:TIM barrel protein [Verrucomicrobiae bacterium]